MLTDAGNILGHVIMVVIVGACLLAACRLIRGSVKVY